MSTSLRYLDTALSMLEREAFEAKGFVANIERLLLLDLRKIEDSPS
jgi:hypothetical protein